MTRVTDRFRSAGTVLALAVTLAGAAASAGPPAAVAAGLVAPAVTPSPSRPATIRFEAGVHTGLRFDSAGTVVASRSATLVRRSSASTTERAAIPGRGIHLLVATGIWAGYWIPERLVSYIPGIVGEEQITGATSIRFTAGVYLGYRFGPDWNLASTRTATLTRASSAGASRSAVIDGRPYVLVARGIWAGFWMPGTTTRPSAIACRPGPRTAGAAAVIRSVPRASAEIALTFDGGGRLDPARSILDFLVLERVCATVFPTGAMAASEQGRSVLAVVRAHPELFEVGNHTQHHCDLARGGGGSGCPGVVSSTFVAAELRTAATAILAATGQAPAPYWRPPYGAFVGATTRAAAGAGYPTTVMWNVDTIDWRPLADGGPTAYLIATKIRLAAPGSIVLMHLGGYATREALPWALAGLRDRGLVPTTISSLLD